MIPDINNFTWQSLHEYIERIISSTQNALQAFNKDARAHRLATSTGLEHQLDFLQWCLSLVNEMQHREDMQVICPIMSVGTIRLRCRHAQYSASDFAWIVPIANNRYSLKRINSSEPEVEWYFEGDTNQVIEKVEKLVKEICSQEKH